MNCYIHVPFCAVKCGYCAFYSEAGADSKLIDAYFDRLENELSSAVPAEVQTLYVGGGTPTLPDISRLERFIGILSENISLAPGAEISIEANPETLDKEKIALLRHYFNRISLGVQSFDPVSRERIGRRCSQEKLIEVLEVVRNARFNSWNCDLIYALPGQSAGMWEDDLHAVCASGADHVSCYALTPEENSRLGAALEEDDDRATDFYHIAGDILGSYGIQRYEVSNYARPGHACRHNQNVWRGGLLRGFGPAAAGFDGDDRMIQVESLGSWLAGVPPEVDKISRDARLNEIFAVNLRTVEGWNRRMWEAVPHADSWENRLDISRNLQKIFHDCLLITENSIKLTGNGLLFWNSIAQELF